ncbi:MAG: glycosyltransferase [Bacteroidales bacterium]|jgi:glycosyltransferase involved in cell wall biosynthesis|nr:glycosyltransferase [Bacteroidales bacterium]
MKVVHINTTDKNGGAAIAACRLHNAMLEDGIDSNYLVLNRTINNRKDILTVSSVDKYIRHPVNALFEKFAVSSMRNAEFSFSVFDYGMDISKYDAVKNADIIYIHWINTSFISRRALKRLLHSGRPVFWFMHDMFPITGGCHHSLHCQEYRRKCENCFYYGGKYGAFSKSKKQLKLKEKLYKKYGNLSFIAPSLWLFECAKKGSAARHNTIYHIPNMIDPFLYRPVNKRFAKEVFGIDRGKKIIGIGALNLLSNPYKGWAFFCEALDILADKNGKLAEEIQLLVFGSFYEEKIAAALPFKTYFPGSLQDDYSLVLMYNCLDVFVIPSLAENFPQTVLESISSGVPVVGFDVGGISDLVNGDTGCLAEYKNSKDLACGIEFLLNNRKLNVQNFIEPFSKKQILKRHKELWSGL